ncbi:hypothetical protein KEF29_37280 [Streptomyces tuirus]|uniref:DUF3592 domain-containing protein n=1 Tax=Streptomyces tuirus TaxID=68278 RepID=A0A941J3S9_9ACTN|nr:hypothetical protein [Streptomyces tuirus]
MAERAVRTSRDGSGDQWRADVVRWAVFNVVCAGGSLGLAWLAPVVPLWAPARGAAVLLAVLVLPLAAVLVPVVSLRRVPRKQRKVAWQLVVPLAAGVALGLFGNHAGDRAALVERGEWTAAVVVSKDDSGTNYCDVRTVGGREISPSLSEGDGCEDWVEAGDTLRVRYDAAGVASPTSDRGGSSNAGLLAALFLSAAAMGTWGGVRQNRWDREYVSA